MLRLALRDPRSSVVYPRSLQYLPRSAGSRLGRHVRPSLLPLPRRADHPPRPSNSWLTFLLLLLIAWDVCLHGEEHESRIKDYSGLKREMTRDSARAGLSPVRTRMSAVGEVAGNGNGV